MGAIEFLLYFSVTWIMVAVFFTLGFLCGRASRKFDPGPYQKVLRKTVPTVKPLNPDEPVVPGVDVTKERIQIAARARKELGLSEKDASKFADDIIKKGSAVLGRLHSKG